MHHLDNHRDRHMRIGELTHGICRQGHQSRTQVFALSVQSVIRVWNNGRIKGIDLLGQAIVDGLKKRLDRIDYLFPGKSRLDNQCIPDGGCHHFGISRKHVREI